MSDMHKKSVGRRKINPALKATAPGWSMRPDFIQQVEEAANREGAASTSEWVRSKLAPHLTPAGQQ